MVALEGSNSGGGMIDMYKNSKILDPKSFIFMWIHQIIYFGAQEAICF